MIVVRALCRGGSGSGGSGIVWRMFVLVANVQLLLLLLLVVVVLQLKKGVPDAGLWACWGALGYTRYRIVVTVIVAAGVVVITDDAAVVLLTLLLSKTVRILLQYPCRHPRTSMFVLILVVQANACRYLDSKSAAVAAAGVLLPLLLSVTV